MTIAPASYTLETLGFDPSWQGAAIRAAFTLNGTLEDFALARVSAVHRTRCELLTCERGELIKLSAPLRPVENDYGEEEYPVVGDWVLTQPIPGTGGAAHPAEHKPLAILPRRSYLTRPSATRESADQPVAANVDMLCIVEPCFPEPSIGRIERYTALAHASGVQVALILTKGDLVTAEQLTNYRDSLAGGVDAVLAVCTDNGYDPAPVAELVAGRTAAFLGRSGAGKSTLAQVIAGTLRLDSGTVSVGERVVDDAATFVPARRRGVAMVSQAPRIFTHMSVLSNVAFPLRVRGVGRAEARAAALDQLRAVGIADLAYKRASDLSGGQAARVAIARALVFRPDVLILDEPTAALDVEATVQVSAVLRERLTGAGITTLLVSHDIAEVLALASHMIVMGEGRIVEEGEPARVLASPTSVFAARLAGLNIITGPAVARPGLIGVRVGEGTRWAAADSTISGEEPARIALTFPPEAVALSREESHASPRSVLPGVVAGIDVDGSLVTVRVALAGGASVTARVTASAWADLGLGVGDSLWASVKATQVRAIPVAARE